MIHLILNPSAGKGKAMRYKDFISDYMRRNGLPFQVFETEYPSHATELAAEAVKNHASAVVGVGGDGTLLEVATGLMGSNVPLGVIPLGNGNDFIHSIADVARYKNYEQKLTACMDIIREDMRKRIDIIKITSGDDVYYSINIANIGMDADIACSASELKNVLGSLSYLAAVVLHIIKFKLFDSTLTIDGDKIKSRLLLIAICNGARYGGGFIISPGAKNNDGRLDICTVTNISKPKTMVLFPSVLSGKHTGIKEVNIRSCKTLVLDYSGSRRLCLDGNVITLPGPLRFEVIPNALSVLYQHKIVK